MPNGRGRRPREGESDEQVSKQEQVMTLPPADFLPRLLGLGQGQFESRRQEPHPCLSSFVGGRGSTFSAAFHVALAGNLIESRVTGT